MSRTSQSESLLSVLIFSYNHEDYISETIESVVSQNCNYAFEVIISDDGSTDKSKKIILEFKAKYPKIIQTILNTENLGLNKTFYNAINHANGKYIALLGGDDYWIDKNKLEEQLHLLENNDNISFIHTGFKVLVEKDNILINTKIKNWFGLTLFQNGKDALLSFLCCEWSSYPSSSTACFRKEALIRGMNNFPEILKFDLVGEGSIIHSSLTFFGGLYYYIPKETTVYRIREKSLSHRKNNIEQFNYEVKYLELRIFIGELYKFSIAEKKKIVNRGLFILFFSSLRLNTISEYRQVFSKYKNKEKMKLLSMVSKICRIKIFRKIIWFFFYFINRFYFLYIKNSIYVNRILDNLKRDEF